MIEKMKLVSLTTSEKHLEDLLKYFVVYEGFHPVSTEPIIHSVHGAISYASNNPSEPLYNELLEMEQNLGLNIKTKPTVCLLGTIDEIQKYIEETHQDISTAFNRIKAAEEEVKSYKEAVAQVRNLADLDIALEDLFQAKFVSLRFGKLPLDVSERLQYYTQSPFIFVPFHVDASKNELWCLYLTSNVYEREIDNLFTSMFFERIHIPAFVHGTPGSALIALNQYIQQKEAEIVAMKADLVTKSHTYENHLILVKGQLQFLSRIYQARQYVVGLGDRVSITGFIEQNRVEAFKEHFDPIPEIEIVVRDANSDKRFQPPTKLRNNWLTRPFQMFVDMYGIPSYKDIDPTVIVAITYSLLFGIMFGDFGQGLAVALIGFLLGKFKKMPLGQVMTRIGLSSAFFGLVYGETFGNETFLEPFYAWLSSLFGTTIAPIRPMETSVTMNLLLATVGIGAAIILSMIIVNTIAKFRNKDYAEALFSSNGVSGLFFYGFILIGILLQMLFGIPNVFTVWTIVPFIVVPIILIFLKEPLHRHLHHEKMFPDGFGGFFIEGFFELFEVLLSYVTNTLSFLRVGGFVLSHAGMMLVVNTLMAMASGAGTIVAAVLGNLFVMALEGLIVGIQVLRLEFYEMFSRCFEGDGINFDPIFKEV